MADAADPVTASGLWASYGDWAEARGMGKAAARAVGQMLWDVDGFRRPRLARVNGTYDAESGEGRDQAWRSTHRDWVTVQEALGYNTPHPHPKHLRLTVDELEMLYDKRPPSPALRARVAKQRERLTNQLGGPDDTLLQWMVEQMRALEERLASAV